MLALRDLPARYADWNRRHGAPFGYPLARYIPERLRMRPGFARLAGPFAFQRNNTIRRYEYPWAFEAIEPRPGLRVLEIGGGLSGFQWTLAEAGCEVVNVDPGERARGRGWPVDAPTIARMRRRFLRGAGSVTLKSAFLQDLAIPESSFDRVLSVSVIEHVPRADIEALLEHVRRVLVPGGRFVLTVDLFLDLVPFTNRERNEFGENVSIRWLVERSGMRLRSGEPAELYGYDEFDAERVRRSLDRYLVGEKSPALAQLLVLEKPADR